MESSDEIDHHSSFDTGYSRRVNCGDCATALAGRSWCRLACWRLAWWGLVSGRRRVLASWRRNLGRLLSIRVRLRIQWLSLRLSRVLLVERGIPLSSWL